ncbi:glycine--tRNA ligase [Candidatus Campbellbacteria bacterium]|nr:MAG: glycine--tRNA ligase [Candidatus Campbellbacteria bacterium]
MDQIIRFLKEKGFVFPSSEIYGGYAGVYDFGPLGTELMKNIKDFWWKENISKKENYFGIDSGIFKDPKVWIASGHVDGFADPMSECKKCNTRVRVDKELLKLDIFADDKMEEEELKRLWEENKAKVKCLKCGSSDFSEAKKFNLLVKSNLGNFTEQKDNDVYLPGEACQGIYLNYKNVVDTMFPKLPFGIGQIGKAFRNEISPRNFLFRTREFEQADTQFFVYPKENQKHYEKIKEERMAWYLSLGLSEENLKFTQHKHLVFYADDAWDIEYNYPTYGFDEMEGLHDRTDYDLTQHQKFSKTDLSFNHINQEGKSEKVIPYIIETSAGLGRIFLAVISEAYQKEVLENGEEREVLKLKPFLAPVKIAFLPLVKKDGLSEKAHELFVKFQDKYECAFANTGTVGKRYRKQDQIGTPFCVTVDYDTMKDESVTVRNRDNLEQERVKIEDLEEYFEKKFSN